MYVLIYIIPMYQNVLNFIVKKRKSLPLKLLMN